MAEATTGLAITDEARLEVPAWALAHTGELLRRLRHRGVPISDDLLDDLIAVIDAVGEFADETFQTAVRVPGAPAK